MTRRKLTLRPDSPLQPRRAGFGCPLGLAGLLSILLAGCRPAAENSGAAPSTAASPAPAAVTEPLRLLVVDDGPLAAAIEREWQSQGQGPLDVRNLAAGEDLVAAARRSDAIVFPPCMLGELIQAKAVRPLPPSLLAASAAHADAVSDYRWDDLLPLLRREELRWGKSIYGVPFGSPPFVLLYRRDLLRQWNLKAPTTWAEYQMLLEQLHSRTAEANAATASPVQPTAEPLGPNWAARMLLARAAAYARHRNQHSTLFHFATVKPLVNQPPFVRALQELVEAAKYQPAEAVQMSPAQATQQVLSGRSVMAIGWPTAADDSAGGEPYEIGFAELPGSSDVYHLADAEWQQRGADEPVHVPTLGIDGRMGSVSWTCGRATQAGQLLLWLTARDQGPRISSRSIHTTLFRQSHLDQPQLWVEPLLANAAPEYAAVLAASQTRPCWFMMLRLPGQTDYLSPLDQAVRDVIQGKLGPQEALDQVAADWNQITQRRNVETQRQANLQSLGL